MTKALVLMSGGLDSILAAKLLMEQNIQIEAVTFVTPFFDSTNGEQAAEKLGIPIHIIDFTEIHLEMLKNPKHGYGRFMNPCIDCHALMIREAGKLMNQLGASFIATGEVLGERPKSQNYKALQTVEEESGLHGLVVRPLSAKLLPVTSPEIEGLIDRDKLLDIQGRSRKRQIELARQYGISEYPTPAGGCLLTDPVFSERLKKLYDYEGIPSRAHVQTIKLGRLFISSEGVLIAIMRNEEENNLLVKIADSSDTILEVMDYAGPLGVILSSKGSDTTWFETTALIARYGKAKSAHEISVKSWRPGMKDDTIKTVENPLEKIQINSAQTGALGTVSWLIEGGNYDR